jgi:1,4-dihydroxy-2-naphthoate octaprenyltransferase
VGLFSGFFYSNKPFRWVSRGIGEILTGFCYSWLPLATGSYLVTGFFNDRVLLLSIPVGLSIFNVALMNEFPDEDGDRAAGKRNLVVRFGKERMSDLYLGLSILTGFSFVKVITIFGHDPWWLMMLAVAPLLLTVWSVYLVWQKGFWDAKKLQILCRNTVWVNLSMTMILTVQQTLIV